MKLPKFIVAVLLLSLSLLASCSTDETSNEIASERNINKLQIKSVQALDSIDEQRIAFSMLSNREKADLWTTKLNDIIANENLTIDQETLIRDLVSNIKPEGWDKADAYHEYFCDIYLKDFISDASELFDSQKIYSYFYTPKFRHQHNTLVLVNPRKKSCDCLQGTWFFDCAWADSTECGSSNCEEVDGCGILNTSFCNGRCR